MSQTPNIGLPLQEDWVTALVEAWAKAINDAADPDNAFKKIDQAFGGKQETLVSGENIKTINGTSILGEGDMDVGTSIPVLYW